MIALIDTHCHLDFEAFDVDRINVLERARQIGVQKILNPGIDLASSQDAIRLAETNEMVFAAVGLHPNSPNIDEYKLEQIKKLSEHPKVVAIGEIGLDYYREYNDRNLQKNIFYQQLKLAAELKLPVIVHNRQADEDIEDILQEWCEQLTNMNSPLVGRPGVLHSFSSGYNFAQRMIQRDFFIGISGPITFKNAVDIRQLVESLDLGKILIETDAPFLTPYPYRGKRNEPGHVIYIAKKIAEIHKLNVEEIASITNRNAGILFNW